MPEQVDRQLTSHDHVVLTFDDSSIVVKFAERTGEPDELTLTIHDPIEATDLGHALQRAAAIGEAHFDAEAFADGD